MYLKNKLSAVLAIASALLSAHTAHAQKHFELGLTGGLSSPMGNFAKGDYANLQSGFARTGYNIGIKASYFFNHHFGITALVANQGYGFKNAEQVAGGYKEDFDLDEATFTTKGKTQSYNFLAGPEYRLPFAKQFSVNGRFLLGVASARLAGNTVELEDVSTLEQMTATKVAFAIQPGIAVQYNVIPRIGIALGLDYFYAKPNFTIDNENRNNSAGRELTSYNEAFQSLNTNLTISYTF